MDEDQEAEECNKGLRVDNFLHTHMSYMVMQESGPAMGNHSLAISAMRRKGSN